MKNFLGALLWFLPHLSVSQDDVALVDIPKGYYAFTFQEDRQGSVWVGLSNGDTDGGLGYYKGSVFYLVSGTDSIPSGSVHESLKFPDGSLLMAGSILSREGFLLLFHITPVNIDIIEVPIKLSIPFVNCLALVNNADIYIGTPSGLVVLKQGEWHLITQNDGLPSNTVTSVVQDRRSIIWVATELGLASITDGIVTRVPAGSRVINRATSLSLDKSGYLWAGARFSSEGISVFNGKLWETFSARHGLADNSVSTFHYDSKGNLWIGSCFQRNRGGVSRFDGREWVPFDHPTFLAKPCVDAIASDARGNLWFGGSLSTPKARGITVFDGNNWYRTGNSSRFKAERVIKFYPDSRGRLWVSSFEGLFIISSGFNFTR